MGFAQYLESFDDNKV